MKFKPNRVWKYLETYTQMHVDLQHYGCMLQAFEIRSECVDVIDMQRVLLSDVKTNIKFQQ